MRVKRFVANTIQEAMLQVKMEMGKDAVILHTRKFKEGGFLGLFSKEFVEVTAAVDNNETFEKDSEKIEDQKEHNKQIIWPEINETVKKTENDFDTEERLNADTKENSELKDMKKLMHQMMEQLENASFNIGLNKVGEKFYQKLIKNEVEELLAKRIIKKIIEKIPPDYFNNEEYLEKEIIASMCRIFRKPRPIKLSKVKKQQVLAFVGPTGVGKTTTIAKLAANFAINEKKKIAFITCDTYRIAAVDQLKTVGEIIGVPVEVVFTPQSIKNSIREHSDKDLIFIDTAGRSHKNDMHMGELKGFIEAAEPDNIFLVLSATTKYKDMLEIINNYERINFNSIIFTKLDETSTYGSILSIIGKTKKYLSYFTTGQSVPDDIEVVDHQKLARLILGDDSK